MINPTHVLWIGTWLLLGAAAISGCARDEPAPPTGDTSNADAWQQGLDPDVAAALSELSKADRDIALEQRTCPVSGKTLGSMGKPIKVNVQGEDVFVCCDACVDTIKENPDEYLAKLNEA